MNITVASDVDVTTERVTTFSEASEGEPSMTAVGDPIVTSEEPTNLSMSMDTLGDKTVAENLSTAVTVRDALVTVPATSTESFQFKQFKWTPEIVLLTVILCGAFVIVCLLLGWTTSIAHLKSRHRRRIRQLIEGYQKSRSKVYCSGKTLFSPLEAWSQDFEYHSNMSQSSEYARVKRGLMALEGETPQTIGLTTFTRPSRGDLVDTSQLYTQSQLPLSTFPRPPKSAHQRIGAYMDDHQSECQF
ncbi:hypothetical protein ECG_09403 [Echinococcus granulosus]|uniref:Expressed conserved protein n=1 Tax=Echinococcus granulosus TaxID=6210 RepID=A0A068WSY6_ECHGR|nr:hypothetical protein ECG_09403 [Echinococcus granulosus]CDS20767.1 hypothetical protein EgrG_001148100 [Echinococcus granulosus]